MSPVRRSFVRNTLAINVVNLSCLLLMMLLVVEVESRFLIYARLGLTLLVVGYVPGAYVLDFLHFSSDRFRTTLYAVGLSTLFYMLYGFAMNVLYLGPEVPFKPFTDESMLIVLAGILTYSVVTDYSPLQDRLTSTYRAARTTPSPYLLGVGLTALSVLGSHYVNVGIGRELITVAFVIIGFSSAVLVFGNLNIGSTRFLIYSITFSLLVQDLARTPYLSRIGDTQVEYYFSNLSITHEFWAVSLYSTKSTSLYLNVLYPIVKLMSGVGLFEVIRFVYPVAFALISLVLFELYRSQFNSKVAVAASLAYVFADQFFILLSHSTRTGFAYLMVSLFLLALVDEDLAPRQRKMLSVLFLFSILFVHYGTAIVISIAIIAIYQSARFVRWYNGAEVVFVSWRSQVMYLVFILSWFLYTGAGKTYDILVFNLFVITRRIVLGKTEESTTSQVANKELPSITSQLIRVEYLIVVMIAGLVIAIVGLIYLLKSRSSGGQPISIDVFGEEIELSHVNLVLPIGGMALLVASFVPTSIFRLNRLYMLAAIFFIPYTVIGLAYTSGRLPLGGINGRNVLSTALVCVLLLNSGILGLHLFDETTHQVTIDKNVIEERGDLAEMQELYANYFPPSDYRASTWVTLNRQPGSVVYGDGTRNGWLPYFSYVGYSTGQPSAAIPPGPYRSIEGGIDESGYIYVSKLTTEISPGEGSGNRAAQREIGLQERIIQRNKCTKVYANSRSHVFTTSCVG